MATAVTPDLLKAYYNDLFGRDPDPNSGGYLGRPADQVYMELRFSQERANYNAARATEIQNLQNQITELKKQLSQIQGQITDLNNTIAKRDETIAEKESIVADQNEEIQLLRDKLAEVGATPPEPTQLPADPIAEDTRGLIQKIVEWFKKYVLE